MSKIYIVEDDAKIREELKIFLNNNGYEVEVIQDFFSCCGGRVKFKK